MKKFLIALAFVAVVGAASAGHDNDVNFSFSVRTDNVQVRYGGQSHGGHSDVCSTHRKSRCGSCGRLVSYQERYWKEGYWRTVEVPARYEWRYDHCGSRVRVMVSRGYYTRVWVDGCWQTRTVTKWVPHRHGHGDRHDRYDRRDRHDYDRDRYSHRDRHDDRREYRRYY